MLSRKFLAIGFPLLFLASNTNADDNPAGTTITTTLSGTSPITNEGVISVSSDNQYGMLSSASSASFTNSGTINTSGTYGNGIRALGASSVILNSGTINASNTGGYGIYIATAATNSSVTNSGAINTTGQDGYGIVTNSANGSTLTNSGSISTSGIRGVGIFATNGTGITIINSGSVNTTNTGDRGAVATAVASTILTNSGIISATQTDGVYSGDTGSFTTITNTGSITAGSSYYGINNQTSITTLNNAQGGSGSSAASTALTYKAALPTNYNIIISSASYYGQVVVTSGTGSTNFGINTASSITTKLYTGVLQGLTTSNVGATRSGTYGGLSYTLALQSGSTTIWDLIFTGGSTVDTQQSLVNTSQALQGTFTILNTALTNSLTYDCPVFDKNNICISAGGRNTAVSAANGLNNTNALLIAAYRPHPNYRIGAYADQNLSVNNAGSTVNLGNNTPLVGLFGAWNQRLDGTGIEVKVSAAYGQNNAIVTRQIVSTSEAGSGGSPINSQGARLIAKYGFGVLPDVIVNPYVGVRYTQNSMDGYTEATSTSVTAPLTYSALNIKATTVFAGLGALYRVIPQAMLFASAGIESDIDTANGAYSASGVTGLTPINFNANPVKKRATATLGAAYDIKRNQRIGINGIYRQEPYQAISSTTVMATYTVGL